LAVRTVLELRDQVIVARPRGRSTFEPRGWLELLDDRSAPRPEGFVFGDQPLRWKGAPRITARIVTAVAPR
jgi:hypothetical protein